MADQKDIKPQAPEKAEPAAGARQASERNTLRKGSTRSTLRKGTARGTI